MASRTIKLFYVSAREDEALRTQLEKHLAGLKCEGLLKTWHNQQIMPGQPWEHEVARNLESAQMVLLLVSPDFIASDYCYSVEMKEVCQGEKI